MARIHRARSLIQSRARDTIARRFCGLKEAKGVICRKLTLLDNILLYWKKQEIERVARSQKQLETVIMIDRDKTTKFNLNF